VTTRGRQYPDGPLEPPRGVRLIPFDLPEGYIEAAERYWAGREPDAADIRRILGLPEPDGE